MVDDYNMEWGALLLQSALYRVHCANIMHCGDPSNSHPPPAQFPHRKGKNKVKKKKKNQD